jgi:hypothetical protein
MPGEDLVRFWLKSLSSFPLNAISWAFEDYLANEVDELGRAWMPKVPQIVARCIQWTDRNSGTPDNELSAKMAQWREEEKGQQSDPEWRQQYQDFKSYLKKLWPGNGAA